MDLSLILLIAAVLVILLLLVVRAGATDALSENDRLSGSEYAVRLPDRLLLEQCLSPVDMEFVAMLRSRALLRLFLRERRRLALAWLLQTRREAARLYRLHLRMVRHAADLRPAAELKLLSAIGLFLLMYGVMVGSVSLYGPFRTRRFLQSLQGLAGVLSNLGDRIAGSVAPGLAMPFSTAPGAR